MTDTTNSILTPYLAWFKAHEKLIIISVGLLFAFHFYGDILKAWTDHDKRQIASAQLTAQTAQQVSKIDAQANTQLLQQLVDLKLQYTNLSAQVQLSVQKRAQETNAQKKKNDSSVPTEIATRTASILRVQPDQVVANDLQGTLAFSSTAAHVNVNKLEDGIAAAANAVDLNKQLAVCTTVTQKQDETITGVRKELSDEKVSHQADVKLERDNTKLAKDENKKQFRNGFKWGFITGIGISIAARVGHAVGF